jgi:hypothetical protein
MKILNLTMHPATPDQLAAGVVEPTDKAAVQALLTFATLPTVDEVRGRATALTNLARGWDYAMIGGASWLIGELEFWLRHRGCTPLHSFTRREALETVNADGSVSKTSVFQHAGWVTNW